MKPINNFIKKILLKTERPNIPTLNFERLKNCVLKIYGLNVLIFQNREIKKVSTSKKFRKINIVLFITI